MNRWVVRFLFPCLILAALCIPVPPPAGAGEGEAAGSFDFLKANLDLPYDAGGVTEEEENAPEILFFYGQQYEASAVVFALDESGSMAQQWRWTIQTREVVRSIADLAKHAEFGVVYYGSRVSAFRESPVAADIANKAAGTAFIYSRNPAGDTCLFEGVIKALEIVRKSTSKYRSVIVTSDGRPDNCATGNSATPAEIQTYLGRTLAANPGLAVKVHTVWVGSGTDGEAIQFMKRLADLHGGTFRMATQ